VYARYMTPASTWYCILSVTTGNQGYTVA